MTLFHSFSDLRRFRVFPGLKLFLDSLQFFLVFWRQCSLKLPVNQAMIELEEAAILGRGLEGLLLPNSADKIRYLDPPGGAPLSKKNDLDALGFRSKT